MRYTIGVVGSRGFKDYKMMERVLNALSIDMIVSGGARGADRLSEIYAKNKMLPTKIFPAQWDLYGKSAGYIRNKDIVLHSDIIIAFWDGQSKGTLHTINTTKQTNKPLIIINYITKQITQINGITINHHIEL